METLIPPVVFGDAESRDGRGVIAHLLDFLFEGHLRDQGVDALIDRKGSVEPWLVGGLLRGSKRNDQESSGNKEEGGKGRTRAGHSWDLGKGFLTEASV